MVAGVSDDVADEVLAVGDEPFQRKCMEKFEEFRRAGRTVVLVSHALGSMRSMCDEVAWLDHGKLLGVGRPSDVVDEYQGATPRRERGGWKTLLADSGLFERTARRLFTHVQHVDEDAGVDRILSVSYIALLPPDEQAVVEGRIRELARGATELHYMTELYLGFSRQR